MSFKVNQIVRHKLDGERLRIKRVGTNLATCHEIDKEKIWALGKLVYPTRISFLSNLEHVE